ncbi:hypothetical protein ACHHYP_15530 [Achlya hypogyna]|uniref:Fanconi-associated nuclease n=1 Tax=Achlya hypogyna TaxID=1202772 RepID=A0A1V9YAN3_ACHHY|nr:hypothetical protein ACHHYP_15530 [Achlya hypogyna]
MEDEDNEVAPQEVPGDLDAYEQHFRHVLDKIKATFWPLLAPEEQAIVDAFLALPMPARALYARLFQRRGPWFRTVALQQYLDSPRIDWTTEGETPPLQVALARLLAGGFITTLPEDTKEYAVVLEAIERACPAPEIQLIMQAIGASAKAKTKVRTMFHDVGSWPCLQGDMLDRLRSYMSTQRRLDGSFLPLATKVQRVLFDQATIDGKRKEHIFLLQIAADARGALRRMHHLAYLTAAFNGPMRTPPKTPTWQEWRDHFFRPEPVLWPGLMNTFQLVVPPTYPCTPSAGMFPMRQALVRYECGRRLRQAMYSIAECMPATPEMTRDAMLSIEWLDPSPPSVTAFASPDPDATCHAQLDAFLTTVADLDAIVLEVRHALAAISADSADAARPPYFAHFEGGYQLAKALDVAIGLYEKLGQYDKAVVLLQELLSTGRIAYKRQVGLWYSRLAINLQQHLKQPLEATTICRQALADPTLREGDRLSLQKRLARLLKEPTAPDEDDAFTALVIDGRPLNRAMGEKSRFIGYDDAGCSVEELVLQHYKREGWHGSHREGAEMRMLFGLVLWDVIFLPLPHVFQTPFQDRPLDLDIRYARHFVSARQAHITEALEEIAALDAAALGERVGVLYSKHEGVGGFGMQWRIPKAYLQLIAAGIGGANLAALLRLWACDTSGMPDLIVVRVPSADTPGVFEPLEHLCSPRDDEAPEAMEVPRAFLSRSQTQLVEVKGPRDKLSDTQLVWLDRFRKANIVAGVCYVKEPNTKPPAKRVASPKPATSKRPRKTKPQATAPPARPEQQLSPKPSVLGVVAKRVPQEIIEISDSE